ncbi:Transducin-like enhancer protein 3-B [Ataeniobius toweri]|uniref:Transducin-like enhancer protein 3-B n=1 Tax=Ataeniobius toweri TaxID=208326 RepID=A0ABU7A5L9_9TELE|nr:Transducin-like enhancer protein 3-B [Ataeniobius toweri]
MTLTDWLLVLSSVEKPDWTLEGPKKTTRTKNGNDERRFFALYICGDSGKSIIFGSVDTISYLYRGGRNQSRQRYKTRLGRLDMYPQGRHPAPHQPGQPGFKFTVAESCDRIKDEFQFLQAQYHSLKVEYDKLANEKTEMQRHYVMYYEMSYGLNIEMHKQTEIAKRLNAILAQIMPFLSQEHQQQVAQAVERAKQVTMTELNAIIGVRGLPNLPLTF